MVFPGQRGRVRVPAGPYCYEVRVQNRYGLANDVVSVAVAEAQ